MAYTTPHVWTDPEIRTAALFNTYIRDNLSSLRRGNDHYCRLYLTGNPIIGNNSLTGVVAWQAIDFQVGTIWSASTPTHLTASVSGKYLILATLEWRAHTANLRNLSFQHKSSTGTLIRQYDGQSQGSSGSGKSNVCGKLELQMTAGQYVEVRAFQSSGTALALHGGARDRTHVAMIFLGGDGAAGAWTTPHNWALGETPTAALLNPDLVNNVASLRNVNDVAIRVHRTATQSLPNNARTAISWQAAQYQQGITWAAGANGTQLIVPRTGLYNLATNLKFANVVGGRRGVGWRLFGSSTTWEQQNHPGNGVDTVSGFEDIELRAGDAVEVWGFQSTGSALNTAGTTEGDCWAALSLVAEGHRRQVPRWVPPRTWQDGPDAGRISAAMLQTQIHDELVNLRNGKGATAVVWLSDNQSITANERGAITWDRWTRDVGGLWDGGSKFVAPVDGYYLGAINVEWVDSGVAGTMGIGYRLNGKSTNYDLQFQDADANGESQSAGDLIPMLAGDYLEWFAYQSPNDSPDVANSTTSGESLSIHGGTADRTRSSLRLWAAAV